MAQLKMYWLPGTPVNEVPLPEGYSVSNYKTEADKLAWCECCRNGLVGDDEGPEAFDNCITNNNDIHLEEDVFFLDYGGEHIGTVTAFRNSKENTGDMHMVAIRTDFRGKGLAKYLTFITINHLSPMGVDYIFLTTDEWRKGAVKSYLSGGFLPVEYALGMQDRWEDVLEDYKIDCVQMLYEDATPYKVIYRRSKAPVVKVGVFGAGRGRTMMNYCAENKNAKLVAICDKREEKIEDVEKEYGSDVTYYNDFDEFIKHDMDLVVLANYANAHAPFAIRCLEAGKHVLSEVLPVQTLKEAVELIEAVERTGKKYIYAENCCYMGAPKKMKELVRKGVLGTFEYGEGEYMHNCESIWHNITYCEPDHWRNTMSAFYYCTHSLGPLIHISGQRPVSVTGFEAPFNARMARMGAKAGPFGVEMVTLESGAILKSLHGVGPAKNSTWYSIYGSKGRMESSREDAEAGGTNTLYVNCDKEEYDNFSKPENTSTGDAISDFSGESGHGGSDFYVMYHTVQAIRGNRNADIVDVYEAMDMFLPGMFAYYSVLEGGKPMAIPNLRDPAERDLWRNDTRCTDPEVAGDMLIPSYSKGNPDIPDETYEFLKQFPRDKNVTIELRKKMNLVKE